MSKILTAIIISVITLLAINTINNDINKETTLNISLANNSTDFTALNSTYVEFDTVNTFCNNVNIYNSSNNITGEFDILQTCEAQLTNINYNDTTVTANYTGQLNTVTVTYKNRILSVFVSLIGSLILAVLLLGIYSKKDNY